MKKNLTIVVLIIISNIFCFAQTKVELVSDFNTGSKDGIFNGSRVLYSFNNQLYFNGNKETNNYELYSTDGSNNNFKLIKDIKIGSSGSYPHTFISTNSLMYFSASDNDHGRELWKTDGTEQGTSIVKDITSGSENTNIIQRVIFKNKLFFVVKNQNATTELYFSDGTDLGTNAFRPTNDTSIYAKDIQILCVTDSMLYFTANISKFGVGRELFKTSGSVNDIKLVKDFNQGTGNTIIKPIYNNGKELFIYTTYVLNNNPDSIYTKLYKSNGNEDGTEEIFDSKYLLLDQSVYQFFTYLDKTYFNSTKGYDHTLMVTDGTKLGTTKVEKDSGLISLGFVEYNGYMYYLDGTQHHKLVKTNGIIKQNVYNTGSFNENIVEIKTFIKNNKLYYFYNDFSPSNYSDLIEISNDTAKSIVSDIQNFIEINDILEFNNNLYCVIKTSNLGNELYKLSNSGVLTKELETEKILIYPNPIKNINLVNFNSKETGEINIYNSVGQKVLTQNIESIGNQTISVDKLEVGTYFVQMVGKERIYIGKIIKE